MSVVGEKFDERSIIIDEDTDEDVNEDIDEDMDEDIDKFINEDIDKVINEDINEDIDEAVNENINEDVNEDIAQKAKGDSEQKIDVNIMLTNNETAINKEEKKDESELFAVDDVKLNEDDETDEIEDISAYYKNAIIKLQGELVEFDPERNVSSSFVPIGADSLSIIDVFARNQKEMARIRLANEANASRAKSKAKASLSQLFSDISSNSSAVQSEAYESITKISRDTMRSIKNPRARQRYR